MRSNIRKTTGGEKRERETVVPTKQRRQKPFTTATKLPKNSCDMLETYIKATPNDRTTVI